MHKNFPTLLTHGPILGLVVTSGSFERSNFWILFKLSGEIVSPLISLTISDKSRILPFLSSEIPLNSINFIKKNIYLINRIS